LARHGKDLGRLLSDLLNHFRNLVIYQVSGGDLRLLEVSENEVASLKEQAALASTESLTRVMEVLTDAEGRLRDAASKKIFFEVVLLRAIQARDAVSIERLLTRLQQLRAENAPSTSASASAAAPAAAPAKTEPVRVSAAPAPAAQTGAEVDLTSLWTGLLESVGRASPFTRTYLVEAHPISLTKGLLTIGFDSAFAEHIDLVNNPKTHSILQTKLAELGHTGAQVKFIKAERPENWSGVAVSPAPAGSPSTGSARASEPAREPVAARLDEFKNDPLIQKALEVFRGQIVEVRA
jgi:DNA polymerase-3 subunit gamma/tau